ncbi:hypothetical protein Pfo_015763 [Paulownia fortunei]|nr:hypothetical protein Pfo_015763 [Paulownia fortunei]
MRDGLCCFVSLAQTIDQILNHHKYSISPDEKLQIISMQEHIIFFQAFLENFPEEANSLEGRIRDVANEAEDIIEYFIWKKQILSRYRSIKWIVGLAEKIQIKLKHQLKKVTQEIDSIAREVMDIKNSFRIFKPNDLIAIKARLCGESSKLQVIPITGMGGIGKTTLARNAYDDPLTIQYFDIRVWITISQDYSAQEILSSLLVSMKVYNEEISRRSNELIEEKVYKSLKGKRYLIVMDDMWSTKAWDDVRKIFPDDGNGSRIMLTTRLSDVAAYADSSSPLHEMRFMDADQSWNLLWQKVFTHEDCPPELEVIGKEIARSCRGLPLAIVVVAGLLSTVIVATKDGQLAKILSLSYTHLPHHLRPCFLYMGGFPEDHEIHVSQLIKIWIAEGFMKRSVSKSCEEAAEEYLEDLVKRSLVLVTKRKSNGKIKSCSVHDLLLDLCIRKAQAEKFLLHVRDRYVGDVLLESIKNQRRICIAHSDQNFFANIYGPSIRAIICFHGRANTLASLGNFRLLRVLDVVYVDVKSLPDEVFELFHLRYLAFDYPMNIPAAISNLQNLQTLIIRSTSVLLPSQIWRMPQLRHLVSFYFDYLPNPEGATFALENLQTLSAATNFLCNERILKMIPNLKKLGIIYFGVEYGKDYHLHNLVCLHQLEKLKLKIYGSSHFPQKLNAAFPRTLKKLNLSGWGLPWTDMTIVGSLPNLQVLKLRNLAFEGDKWETTEGEFPQLKYLLIDQSDLQHWITESSHFPSLKCLVLLGCEYLSEIPDGIGEIPTLELIEVDYLNKSLVDSAKRIQEEQQSWGNDAIQVRCVQY